jgi:hypothetical protein
LHLSAFTNLSTPIASAKFFRTAVVLIISSAEFTARGGSAAVGSPVVTAVITSAHFGSAIAGAATLISAARLGWRRRPAVIAAHLIALHFGLAIPLFFFLLIFPVRLVFVLAAIFIWIPRSLTRAFFTPPGIAPRRSLFVALIALVAGFGPTRRLLRQGGEPQPHHRQSRQ